MNAWCLNQCTKTMTVNGTAVSHRSTPSQRSESLPGTLEKIPLLPVHNRNLELCFLMKCQRGAELVYNSLRLVMRLVAQSCPTLRDPMNCTWPVSSVHRILQARTLEWVAMPSFRGSSQPRDGTQVSCIASGFVTNWATREAPLFQYHIVLIANR